MRDSTHNGRNSAHNGRNSTHNGRNSTHRLSRKMLGRPVLVRFLDHVENLPHPAATEAVGWLVGYDRQELHLCSWRYPELTDDTQETHYRILRATIETMEILG